ncbi:hypothetical protein BN2497_6837 [Janthinobacterium sp. CG23_2]|nr:hypothetical protein BN2497_6837 [Janthinobacterium sp. CG23_2]CUU29816.1 hypothetical protein BN3177_6837 [Janthinobacterium sp. CG23_2]
MRTRAIRILTQRDFKTHKTCFALQTAGTATGKSRRHSATSALPASAAGSIHSPWPPCPWPRPNTRDMGNAAFAPVFRQIMDTVDAMRQFSRLCHR